MRGMFWVLGCSFGLFLATDRMTDAIIVAAVTLIYTILDNMEERDD